MCIVLANQGTLVWQEGWHPAGCPEEEEEEHGQEEASVQHLVGQVPLSPTPQPCPPTEEEHRSPVEEDPCYLVEEDMVPRETCS